MELSQEIRILDLLAEREEQFRRIAELESQVQALLYPDAAADELPTLPRFPFPAPPQPLPSEGRTSATKCWRPSSGRPPVAKPKNRGKKEPALPAHPVTFSLRPLQAGVENAYRVTYWENGQLLLSFHAAPQALEAMLELDCENFRLERIETVLLDTMDACQMVECLWERPAPSPTGPEKSC